MYIHVQYTYIETKTIYVYSKKVKKNIKEMYVTNMYVRMCTCAYAYISLRILRHFYMFDQQRCCAIFYPWSTCRCYCYNDTIFGFGSHLVMLFVLLGIGMRIDVSFLKILANEKI